MKGIRIAFDVAMGIFLLVIGSYFLYLRLSPVEIAGQEFNFLEGRVGYLGIAFFIGAGLLTLFGHAKHFLSNRSQAKVFTQWTNYSKRHPELSPPERIQILDEIRIRNHLRFPFICCRLNLDILQECRLLEPELNEQITAIEAHYHRVVSAKVRKNPQIMLRPKTENMDLSVADQLQIETLLDKLFEELQEPSSEAR